MSSVSLSIGIPCNTHSPQYQDALNFIGVEFRFKQNKNPKTNHLRVLCQRGLFSSTPSTTTSKPPTTASTPSTIASTPSTPASTPSTTASTPSTHSFSSSTPSSSSSTRKTSPNTHSTTTTKRKWNNKTKTKTSHNKLFFLAYNCLVSATYDFLSICFGIASIMSKQVECIDNE